MFRKTYCFDDLLLVPQNSKIVSREDVDLTVNKNIKLLNPIFIAPMDTISGPEMGFMAIFNGCSPVLHRGDEIQARLNAVRQVSYSNVTKQPIGVAIGLKEKYEWAWFKEAGCSYVCLDAANGHNIQMLDAVSSFKKENPEVPIMAGNVATDAGAWNLYNAGADIIRIGIGGGGACKTRIQTGFGVPTLTSVFDCHDFFRRKGVRNKVMLVADGGVRTPGDAVKALAAGADAVMMGSYFSGTSHTPGQIIEMDGKKYKEFRGMASAEAKGHKRYVEGESGLVPYKGNTDRFFLELLDGIRSGLSYAGAKTLQDLCQNAEWAEVSSLGAAESKPHAF